MKEKIQKKLGGLKLNVKFTIVIVLLVMVPISIFSGVLFYSIEDNTIRENTTYMQYTMERSRDNIRKNIDSVNMTTQFFLNDEPLLNVLNSTMGQERMTTEEMLEFYHSDISSLERLVNNNTLLYGVHVYAMNDQVQEMMPVLYNHSRMQRMEWATKEDFTGWNFNYEDTLFDNHADKKIASLVTPVEDHESGCIGIIETAVTMEALFPSLYEDIENEWSCFVANDGSMYFGDNEKDESNEFVQQEMKEGFKKDGIHLAYKRAGKSHYVVSYLYIRELGGTLLSVHDISESLNRVYHLWYLFTLILLAIMAGLAVLINIIVKRLLRHFYEILKSIRAIQSGELHKRIDSNGTDEMGELGTQINKMLDRIETLNKESVDREILVKNSEIRALQNQINAHFIYNVLESIKMMAEIDEEYAISDAITSLGRLLRYSMRWTSENVRVKEEIEYIKNYLALMNLRYDYEIYLSLNIPDVIMEQEIPKMSLQPIVENAICHGIEELAEDTNIYLKGIIENEDCVIEITDAGKGMSQEEVEQLQKKIAGEIETSGGSGNGIGLKNVQDRIHMSFGDKYGIGIVSKQGCYTKVTMRVPMKPISKELLDRQ